MAERVTTMLRELGLAPVLATARTFARGTHSTDARCAMEAAPARVVEALRQMSPLKLDRASRIAAVWNGPSLRRRTLQACTACGLCKTRKQDGARHR